jgi:hypothetical protein
MLVCSSIIVTSAVSLDMVRFQEMEPLAEDLLAACRDGDLATVSHLLECKPHATFSSGGGILLVYNLHE